MVSMVKWMDSHRTDRPMFRSSAESDANANTNSKPDGDTDAFTITNADHVSRLSQHHCSDQQFDVQLRREYPSYCNSSVTCW